MFNPKEMGWLFTRTVSCGRIAALGKVSIDEEWIAIIALLPSIVSIV
jgi:hypothetical protein